MGTGNYRFRGVRSSERRFFVAGAEMYTVKLPDSMVR